MFEGVLTLIEAAVWPRSRAGYFSAGKFELGGNLRCGGASKQHTYQRLNSEDLDMSRIPTLLFALLIASSVAIGDELPRTISVSGQGKAAAPPDIATVRTGVVTQAATAAESLTENNRAMEAVMRVLKQKGIAERDIQTSGFSIYPEYPPRGAKANRIIRYRVNNNVSFKVRKLSRLGEILDALVQAGSNQVSGVTFGIADSTSTMNVARKNAINDARARAELYAQATGVKVGKVITISEQSVRMPSPVFQPRMAMAMAESVPVATGEQEISATINVVYELVD